MILVYGRRGRIRGSCLTFRGYGGKGMGGKGAGSRVWSDKDKADAKAMQHYYNDEGDEAETRRRG